MSKIFYAERAIEEELEEIYNCDGNCKTCDNYDCPLIENEDS